MYWYLMRGYRDYPDLELARCVERRDAERLRDALIKDGVYQPDDLIIVHD